MASKDELWFEVGVRDNVSKVLEDILNKSEEIQGRMAAISEMEPAFENALKIEQAYDRIAVAMQKIESARKTSKSIDEQDNLDKMRETLEKTRKKFEDISADVVALGTKGQSAFTGISEGLDLAVAQVDRYTKGIEKSAKAEARHQQEELRRTDALKSRYNELANLRKQWMDVMNNISPLSKVTGKDNKLGQSLDYRFDKVDDAISNGGQMPKTATGADYDEFIKKVKDRMRELTNETKNYQKELAKLESYQRSVRSAIRDTESRQRIASIKGETAEYSALGEKLKLLRELYDRIENSKNLYEKGLWVSHHTPSEKISRDFAPELENAQRRYNEVLAEGIMQERKDAEAKEMQSAASKGLISAQQGLIASYDRVEAASRSANKTMQQLQMQLGSYFSLLGAERLVRNIIQIGGEFEVQHIALQNILGDIQQANSMFEQMKELAVVSPFNFRQLAAYSKQVAAFGIPYEEMYETTKRLADMSAGLGVDMGRLILAYGQVRSAAVLRGQELRQFTEAGIPLVQELAKEFTALNGHVVSTAEVFDLISKRAVPFEMVKKIMWDMTSEGGRFYDMQYTLSDTLAGKWSNLQDAWEIMLSDFAKGASLSGQFLKGMVEGITSLIEKINTLMPLMMGVGGFFLMRNAGGAFQNLYKTFNYGLNGVESNIRKAQKLHEIELKRQYMNMSITREQYNQGLALNRNKQNYYMLLAQEGRLKEIQIARAVQQKKINTSRLQERILSGEITTREAAQLRLWRAKYLQANLFKLSIREIGVAINTMMGPIGWISLALDVVLSTVLAISSHTSEINSNNQDLVKGFEDRARELKESLESIKSAAPDTEESYKSSIEGLKEIIKQHASNYDAIMLEANGLKTVREQYDFLKNKLGEMRKVYTEAQNGAEDFANSTRGSFERAKENARDYFRQLKNYPNLAKVDIDKSIFLGNFARDTKKIAEEVRKMLPNIGKDEFSNNVFREWRDSMLQELGVGSRESMMIKIRLDQLLNITDYSAAAELVEQNFEDMLNKVSPELANKIRYGKTLEKAEREKVQALMNDVIKQTGEKYPAFSKYLQGLLNDSKFTASIELRIAGGLQVSDLQRTLFNNLPGALSGKGQDQLALWLKDAGNDMSKATAAAKEDLDEYKKNIDAYDKAISNGKKELKGARDKLNSEFSERKAWARLGLGFDYDAESQKDRKGGRSGGSKEDKVLKDLKERLDEVKSFYAEYKKYKEVYGKERSIDILEGLFPSLQGRGREIVDGYEGVLGQIAADMEKRPGGKKVALTVRKLLADIDLDKVKDDLKEQLKAVEKFIQEKTSKWNLYKGLLEKTGDKSFAMTAFTDGVLWDDMTRGLEARLREMMSVRGLSVSGDVFGMDADDAEKFFGAGTAELKLWEEIVKGIRKNWSDGLNEVAAAKEKLLTAEEKVLKAERELADLRSKYGNNDPRAIAKEQEVGRLAADAFEQSEPYLRFYSAILSMTLDEAEKAGAAIKENLVRQLADGTINADKYLKSIKNVNQQLKSVRDKRSDAMTLLRGGVSGLIDKRKKVAEDEAAGATIQVEAASKEVLAARKNLYEVERAGNSQAIIAAKLRLSLAEAELDRLSGVAQKKQQYLQDILGFEEGMSDVAAVVDMVAGAFDGFSKAAMQVSEMLDALGHEGSAETWSDISDTIGAIGSPISAAANALKSAMSGDVGGVISNTVGILTAPITAFAKLHDKKRQREIEKSERRVRALTTSYQNLQTAMESALGGIYTSGGYDEMFGNLKKQRDEIQHQMELEDDKKKTDADKMADYRQQLKELDAQIKDYALDMAKSLYDIDLKAWASQLTDAIVSAWENGEDAVEAYRSKVKDIMKDLTTNILAKKVMENAFEQLGIDNLIASMMDASSGKLDESMLPRLADALGKVGNITVDAVTKSLDAAERQGMIERGTEKTSSASNTIKGISEQTADLLASYINAIRADVSVNRATLLNILYALQGQTEMPAVARAQLQQLEIIATNTGITAENTAAINEIYAILQANVNGINYFRIK